MSLFHNRNYRLLWFSHFAGTLANELFSISIVVLVFASTGSTLQTTGVLVARHLPPLLLGPVAGSLVDRLPRRMVLAVAQLVRAAIVALALLPALSEQVWLGFALVFVLTLAEIVQKPAMLATLPTIVAQDQIVRANSLIFTTTQAAFAIAYLVGGFLVVAVGIIPLVALDIALFLLAAASAALLTSIPQLKQSAQESFWQTVATGFVYLRQHQMARSLITVEFLESWPHGAWTSALMLSFTAQALQAGTDAWGLQNGAFFAGQIIGALLALAYANRLARRPGWVIIGNGFLMGALTLAYAASNTVLAATVISLAFGPPFAMRDVAQDALLQTTVDHDVLGRIYAAREMFARVAFLAGGLLFAALADLFAIRQVYVISGVMYCLVAVYAMASTVLRRSTIATPSSAY
jgi:MFS family permease